MTSSQRQQLDAIEGQGRELARYETSTGARLLLGVPRPGGLEILDVPSARGKRYTVDSGLCGAEAIGALVEDYLRQAERLQGCPMDPDSIGRALCDSDQEELLGIFLDGEAR